MFYNTADCDSAKILPNAHHAFHILPLTSNTIDPKLDDQDL